MLKYETVIAENETARFASVCERGQRRRQKTTTLYWSKRRIFRGALTRFALLALLLLPILGRAEAVYRWVDSAGQVHYGNHPPPKTQQFKPIHLTPLPPPSAAPIAATASAPEPTPPPDVARQTQLEALQAQLAQSRAELVAASQAYEQARAVRLGNERNYASYQQRIAAYAARVRQAEQQVLLIEANIQALGAAN